VRGVDSVSRQRSFAALDSDDAPHTDSARKVASLCSDVCLKCVMRRDARHRCDDSASTNISEWRCRVAASVYVANCYHGDRCGKIATEITSLQTCIYHCDNSCVVQRCDIAGKFSQCNRIHLTNVNAISASLRYLSPLRHRRTI
jgi:hypothetical protein